VEGLNGTRIFMIFMIFHDTRLISCGVVFFA
jgi:hypothetical protein